MAIINKLTAIAEAIRSKTNTTEKLTLDEMPSAIEGIQSGDSSEFGESYWLENINQKTNLSYFFQGWKGERIPKIETSQATTVQGMFQESNVRYIHPLDLSNSTVVSHMFRMQWKGTIENIEVFNTGKVENWTYFAYQSNTIKSVKTLDMSSATSVNNIFASCSNIETLLFVEGTIKRSLNLSTLQKLSDESIDSVVKGFANMTGQTAIVFTVHKDVKARIEANEVWLATLTSKNVTLA